MKKSENEVIFIDAQEDEVTEDKEPIRILKQNTTTDKYLVEFQNGQSWESVKNMREKYPELIEDFQLFISTGQRYDPATLAIKRDQIFHTSTFQAKFKFPKDENYPIFKRKRAVVQQQPEKPNNKDEKQIEKQTQIIQKQTNSEGYSPIADSIYSTNTIIQEKSSILQISQKKLEPNYDDTIKCIKVENGLFNVIWNQRDDGTTPYQSYYNYDQLKSLAPTLVIETIEKELLENNTAFKSLKRFETQDLSQKVTESQKQIQQTNSQLKKEKENNQKDIDQNKSQIENTELKQDHITLQKQDYKSQDNNSKQTQKNENSQSIKPTKPINQDSDKVNKSQSPNKEQDIVLVEEKKDNTEVKQAKKKNIVPSIKPSERIPSKSVIKPLSVKPIQQITIVDKPDTIVSVPQEKQLPEKQQQQQVILDKPILLDKFPQLQPQPQIIQTLPTIQQQNTIKKINDKNIQENIIDEDIIEPLPIGSAKPDYMKELEECYSDVELPSMQFQCEQKQ